MFEPWTKERVEELTDLVAGSDAQGVVTPDDLLCLWTENPETVVYGEVGVGAIAGYLEGGSARMSLLVIDAERRRTGLATDLVARFETWSSDRGATVVEVGAPLGRGPWPGIDETSADLRGFFSAVAYEVSSEPITGCHTMATRFRTEPPLNVEIVRALPEPVVNDVLALVDQHAKHHRPLFDLAIEQGTCLVAQDSESSRSLGVLCHSTARTAWIGPLLVVADNPDADLVPSLVSAACTDLMVAGQNDAYLIDALSLSAADLSRFNAQPGPAFLSAIKPL